MSDVDDEPVGRVTAAAEKDIRRLGVKSKAPSLCETALKIARTMDATSAARDLAALAREFRMTMAELEQVAAGQPKEVSAVDDLGRKRAERLAGGLAASEAQ